MWTYHRIDSTECFFFFLYEQDPPDWTEILSHFRGSELQNYFTKILEDDLKALIKPQYVDQIPKAVKGTVQQLLDKKDECKNQMEICAMLGKSKFLSLCVFLCLPFPLRLFIKINFGFWKKNLNSPLWFVFADVLWFSLDLLHIRDRGIEALSGGELQRFACAMVCIQNGDIFMFDEPSSYLDVKQRLNAAVTIRSLIHPDKYVLLKKKNQNGYNFIRLLMH